MVATSTRDDRPPSLDVVYSEVKERLAAQFEQAESLDRKAGSLIGFSSLVVTVAAGLRLSAFDQSDVTNVFFVILFVVGVALYTISVFFAFRAYAVAEYRRDPEPTALRDLYLVEEDSFTKRRIISNIIDSFDRNARILTQTLLQCGLPHDICFWRRSCWRQLLH